MVRRDDLTEREFDVLVGIAAGETNREIAARLFITMETVRGYSKKIYSKLGVSNRTQAANVARESGWLQSAGIEPIAATPHLEMRGLPTYYSSFVGRNHEIYDLITLIRDPQVRLLTLNGPGGTGKTRLAIEVATRVRDEFPDGVCFVPLNETITDDETFLLAIHRSLGFNTASPAMLFERLRDKHLLILFDNFEQSLAQNHVVQNLLDTAPDVMIMVTSQASLNLSGEWVRRIGNLVDVNEHNEEIFLDAEQLFVDRVRQVDPAFTMGANAECVAEICRIVNGMPLALELAAAWLKNLTCGDVLGELRHSLDILSVTADDLQTRHRGLEAVFEHTWKLLPEAEQRVYKRLSIFVGEFGLEAAQKVAGATLPTLA
ncbi:MAG: LuxR C-terminal-related transcriptional regulator, partial [Chloroflexota bacterium]